MNIKQIIANIDLTNGRLDKAGNSIAYPVRQALIKQAEQIVKIKAETAARLIRDVKLSAGEASIDGDEPSNVDDIRTEDGVSFEQYMRLKSLKALSDALAVVFDLREMSGTVEFVLGANEDDHDRPRDFPAEVRRDIENGRVFAATKEAFNTLVSERKQRALNRRIEARAIVSEVLDLIEETTPDLNLGVVEDVTDSFAEKLARAANDELGRVEQEMNHTFLPAKAESLQAIHGGLRQVLSSLGLTDEVRAQLRDKRKAKLDALLNPQVEEVVDVSPAGQKKARTRVPAARA